MVRYAWALAVVWTALFLVSAAWNVWRTTRATEELALSETRAHVDRERAFNLWAAELGTVYAPVGEDLSPNALLDFRAERDIQTPAGKRLTLVSPHFMLPHSDRISAGLGELRERLTSLKPVDPSKTPDAWERAALTAFENGRSEFSEVSNADGRPYLRLMIPLPVEEDCLACHGRQGYVVGDIRGGLEAWTDLTPYLAAASRELVAIHVTHSVLWLTGLAGIGIGARRLARSIAERDSAEEERRKIEAQVLQTQKLESLGVLAGGIAHDFNNLLTGVLGHASLAMELLPAAAPAFPLIERVERAALRAAELTRQMLAYVGRGVLSVEPLDLNQVVTEMVDLLDVSRSKKATLEYHLADALPAIEADAANIRQVVMNLITNASEALGDGCGTISVATGVRQCDEPYLHESWLHESLPAGPYVFLEIVDTGCGMDRQTLQRIFDPFFTTKFTGRGLGLAAVLGIVRRHRGAIKVESTPSSGTTVRVLFPLAKLPSAAPADKTLPAEARSANGTVLVVDDEPEVLEVARLSLTHLGFRVLCAADGRAALEVFRAHAREIDAVLLDLSMPHMSGEQVYEELRRVRPELPVVLASGHPEQELAERFAGTGHVGFLQKPYHASALAKKLRQVMTDG
jgi:signal transduction histidine kinase/CheY-like chemotaxis protein